jgi:hypothetical protein
MSDLPLVDEALSDEAPSAPARRRRTRWITLAVLGALFLVAVAVFGPLGWHLIAGRGTTLSTPATLAGLTLDKASDANQTADYLRTAVAADTSLDSSVGAVYRDPAAKDRSVLFFGGTASIDSPAEQLDRTLTALLTDQSGDASDLHALPAGSLGGVLKCGTSAGEGGPMAVCGWADNGSLAVALFPGRTVDSAADLLRQMRSGIQHRG